MALLIPLLVLALSLFHCPALGSRCDFPAEFLFGASSSAYQYEGATSEGGRSPSIWDTFAQDPANILDGSNAGMAVDQYHHYEEDVQLMARMGLDSYRFSISWSRLLKPDGQVNKEGLAYYNNLINALLRQGIQPFVTLYHWDLPQSLEAAFGGWLSREIVEHFVYFADTCFAAFGDRVKMWLTFNEPHMLVTGGYVYGGYAPGRCTGCKMGNSSTEGYMAGHNVLLAHAAAVKLYRTKYQAEQGGKIGITLDSFWFEPLTSSADDNAAARRALDFEIGWFLEPITFGDYPKTMREAAGDRLPRFSHDEVTDLVDSMDFLGLNHYTSRYVQKQQSDQARNGFDRDKGVAATETQNGIIIGHKGATAWLYDVPWGFYKLLMYIKNNYNSPTIFVTENGNDQSNDPRNTLDVSLQDEHRISYLKDYLAKLSQAIRDGVDVRGYFVWSFLDNWEWNNGFEIRFGLHFVDYATMRRYPKRSAHWYRQFLAPCSNRDGVQVQ